VTFGRVALLDSVDILHWVLLIARWYVVCGLISVGWSTFAAPGVPPFPARPRLVRWRREAREGLAAWERSRSPFLPR
jgi:hypothetical protein